jgi:hypothetical protein
MEKPRRPHPHRIDATHTDESADAHIELEGAAGRRSAPRIRTLDRAECEAVLARNAVGRLAFSFHDRVDIEPIHYVYADGWLYGRTSPGSKLVTLRHNRWVALEVDEIDGLFDVRSVVVHGAFYTLSPDNATDDAQAWERAIELLRRLIPESWTGDDPVSFRTVVFRIHVDHVTGREASTSARSDGR